MNGNGSERRTRVLVVDDSNVVRRLVLARLRAAGYDVAEASDGQAALDSLDRAPAAVVVTDLSMPRLDGLELLAALRAREAPPEIILLTGSPASAAAGLGAHGFISKEPAALEAIPPAVKSAAERWHRREDNGRLGRDPVDSARQDLVAGVDAARCLETFETHGSRT
jgi:CheY-like chemotaxis protein